MKLIRCNKCNDVVRLIVREWRKCDCGKSGGQYNNDFISATVGGDCEVIGIRNDFFSTPKKNRFKKGLQHIIMGEYVGDVQIQRIKSANGPRLNIVYDRINKELVKLTFKDRRKYIINLKGNKSPKSVICPYNPAASFIDKKNTKLVK